MDAELERLQELDDIIQRIAGELGLVFFPQEFDIVPAQKMLEIMAYHLPVNFSHWSFGRDYEREKTKYVHGFGVPYEVVLNSDPSRAYLMSTNPVPIQAMVMAHVYAHNDFMRNNFHFKPTRRDVLPAASEATARFQKYEQRYGLWRVEQLIDAGLSIQMNIDPDFFLREESEEQLRERLTTPPEPPERKGPFDDLIPRQKARRLAEEEYNRKTPLEPERDVLLYIVKHSPRPLHEWEKDILSVIRDQSRYFMPQRRTKIMNEGWAALWHMRIMDRLFSERVLNDEDHGYYNWYNARVLAENPRILNPYLVGLRMFEDLEDRWNKGRFGREWESCDDPAAKEAWDLELGQGREKIFEVRRRYSDRFFIEEFLTEDLIDRLDLYLYEGKESAQEIRYIITEKDWRKIKRQLVAHLSTLDVPLIFVEDGDYKGKRELYLRHAYEGIELDQEYREKTMENIYFLWHRPIHLESVVEEESMVFTYDGSHHRQRPK